MTAPREPLFPEALQHVSNLEADDGAADTSRTPPTLIGKRVSLRGIVQADYEFLYLLFTREENAFLWRFRGAAPGPEGFMQILWHNVLCQFMVCRTSTGEPLGLTTAYNADHRNGHAYLALILQEHPARSIYAHDANLLFVNYLFRGWSFRKLYGETSELNVAQLFKNALGRYVEVEGVLRGHEFFDGRYWDEYIVALYREVWESIIAERLPRVILPDEEF